MSSSTSSKLRRDYLLQPEQGIRLYPAVAASDITLDLDMKLSRLALKPLRLGARITSSGKSFQRGTTLFEKKLCLESTALPKSFFVFELKTCRWNFRLLPLVHEAGPVKFLDGAHFGMHFLLNFSIPYNLLSCTLVYNRHGFSLFRGPLTPFLLDVPHNAYVESDGEFSLLVFVPFQS